MNVCYVPRDFDAVGCYRCLFPADMLSMLGGHRTYLPPFKKFQESEKFLSVGWLYEYFPADADLYVFQMPLQKLLYAKIVELQKMGKKVVVEIDDDLRNLDKSNPAYRGTKPGVGKLGDNNRVVLDYCVRVADAVTVATPALERSYGKITDAPIYILRNYLDWRMWSNVEPAFDRTNPRGRVRVGYSGGLKWHSGDLSTLKPWFGEWLAENPDVDFVAIGDHRVHDFLNVPEKQRVTTDSVAFRHMELADIVSVCDIGLVPLELNEFNQSKSHLKGLEYAGAGIPFIASPSESYRDWWFTGAGGCGTGFLAERPDEWIRHLDSLATDGELLRTVGLAGRVAAEANSIHNHWKEWEGVYYEVCGYNTDDTGQRVDAFGVYV